MIRAQAVIEDLGYFSMLNAQPEGAIERKALKTEHDEQVKLENVITICLVHPRLIALVIFVPCSSTHDFPRTPRRLLMPCAVTILTRSNQHSQRGSRMQTYISRAESELCLLW